jgi:hypothetical protein
VGTDARGAIQCGRKDRFGNRGHIQQLDMVERGDGGGFQRILHIPHECKRVMHVLCPAHDPGVSHHAVTQQPAQLRQIHFARWQRRTWNRNGILADTAPGAPDGLGAMPAEYQTFEQRIAGQTIGTMYSGTGRLPDRIQTRNIAHRVQAVRIPPIM